MLKRVNRTLKKSASQIYHTTNHIAPPYSPPIASVTVTVPNPVPPPVPAYPPYHQSYSQPIPPPAPYYPPPPSHSYMPPPPMHHGGMSFIPGQWFPINMPAVNVGLGWDFNPGEVYDLDASVTGIDDYGQIKESVYYSRKKGLNGAVSLSGDNRTGKGHGDDEVIYISLDRIPHHISTLAIAINSFKKNSLLRAKRAFIRLFEPNSRMEIGRFVLNRTFDCIGLLVGILHRSRKDGRWYLRVMIDPIEGNVITKSHNSLKMLVPGYLQTFYY